MTCLLSSVNQVRFQGKAALFHLLWLLVLLMHKAVVGSDGLL